MFVLILGFTACSPTPPTVPPVATQPGQQTVPILPTATPVPPTIAPTLPPTQVPLFVSAYRHRTGVFAINLPEHWEAIDDSTDQRILTRLIPPMGYGSRVILDITNEGPLTPDEVRSEAESYVRLNYVEAPGYNEVARTDLPDGRLQFVFLYSDQRGATGRETLLIQQVGSYFAALRVFLSDRDTASLGLTLEQVGGSLLVDPLAAWGTQVAAINPAELRIDHTLLWRDRQDNTYYAGELFNASPADISDAAVTISFCDVAGIVIAEITQPVDLKIIPRGTTAPFGVVSDTLPDDVRVCAEQPSAKPAARNSSYTTSTVLNATVSYHQWRRDLTIEGPLTNFGLSPVTRVEIIIIAYDAENRVIRYAHVPLDSTIRIEPGQSYDFSTVIPVLGGQPHHVATLVQGQILSAGNASLAPTPTPTPAGSPNPPLTGTPGTPQVTITP